MHVKSLKVFCDVVSRRSFSRAADENGISQSGASQMVHHLEERLGVRLIDRSKRPFVLTQEGKLYYDGCRKLLARLNSLEDEVRNLHADVAGRLRLASIYSVGLSHMSSLIQVFMARHPRANIRLEYQHPNRVYELVKEEQVDLGLVSYPQSSRLVEAIRWREEPMALVCAPGHPLAERSQVSLSELNGERMVGFDPDLRIRREVDRALAAHNATVDVVMEFDNTETIKRAIEIGAGISLLPEPTAAREVQLGSLCMIPLVESLVRPLGIIRHRGKDLSETARRFVRLLRKAETKAPEELVPAGAAWFDAAESEAS